MITRVKGSVWNPEDNDILTDDEILVTRAELVANPDWVHDPNIVYTTDLEAWFIRDDGDTTTQADNWYTIRQTNGTFWRRLSTGDRLKTRLFDDFLGDLLADEWAGAVGSDPQAVTPTINAQRSGVVRLTSGDVGGGDDAVDASVLTGALNWYASAGALRATFRVKLVSSVASVAVFVGFTDVSGTAEFPIHSAASADTVTDNATDAVGVLYDTAMATDEWGIIGTKNGTQTTFDPLGVVPVADTYQTIRVTLTAAGAVFVTINGTTYESVANAVTETVALAPVVAIMSRTTAVKSVDVDYIEVEANR
jgi:hypothetical protein